MHAEDCNFHVSYLFEAPQKETGRDGIPASCVLGNIQKVKHLPTLCYSSSLKLGSEPGLW